MSSFQNHQQQMNQNNGVSRVLRIHLYTRNDQTGTIIVEEVLTAQNGSVLPKQYQIALNSVNTFIQNYTNHYPHTRVLQVQQPETKTATSPARHLNAQSQQTIQDPMVQMSTSSLGGLDAYDKYDLAYSSIDSNPVHRQTQQPSSNTTPSQNFSVMNDTNCRA